MRVLHFANLHLEHSFAAEGLPPAVGQQLRGDLRAVLEALLALAAAEKADLVTIAGGLYEQAFATAGTADFLKSAFERCPVPVLMVPGPNDPWMPGSLYHLTAWPKTVTVVRHADLRAYRCHGGTVWAAGHVAGQAPEGVRAVPAQHESPDLLLLPDPGETPLDDATVEAAGYVHALVGSAQRGDSVRCTVAGELLPLSFDTAIAPGGAALIDVQETAVEVTRRGVPGPQWAQRAFDTTGLSPEVVKAALAQWLSSEAGPLTLARATLTGARPADSLLDVELLEQAGAGARFLQILDETQCEAWTAPLPDEPTVRAEFARRLRAAGTTPQQAGVNALALAVGLRALST
jgi:hypothetical protein